MDRIDLVLDVARIDPGLLLGARGGDSSATLRTQVLAAREYADARGLGPTAKLAGAELLEACSLTGHSQHFLEESARAQHLSGRGVTRLLRVARTCADISGEPSVGIDHLGEALGYRAREVG